MQIKDFNTLPIGRYQEILKISRNQSLEEIDKQIKIVALLNDLSEREVLDLPIGDYSKLAEQTAFLAVAPETRKKIADEIKVGDWDLIPVKDIRKMTTAQYIDFQTFSKDLEGYLVEMLSCLLVPKGHKYLQDYDVASLQEDLRRDLPVTDAVSMYAFFLSSCRDSMSSFRISLMQMLKETTDPQERKMIQENLRILNSSLSGDGSQM